MQIKLESLSSVKKKIQVLLNQDQYQSQLDQAYRDLQKNVSIPGFRKGKTPKAMLQKRFGENVKKEVHQGIQREGIQKAIADHALEPINITDVTDITENTDQTFAFSASLETHPSLTLKDYAGLKVAKSKDDVTEESILDVLKRFQDMHATMKPLDIQSPKKGQYASVQIQSLNPDGSPVENTTPEPPQDQLHQVGHESAIKEIDDAIAELSIGQSTKVNIAKNEEKNIPGLHVELTLKAIKEKILPEINDSFAQTLGPYKTLDALKVKIKEDLQAELDMQKRVGYAVDILNQLCELHPTELPETLLAQELISLKTEFFNRTVAQGQSLPEDFKVENLDNELKPEAQKRVHEFIVIKAIAKKENIEVTPQEFDRKISELSHAYKKPPKELVSELSKNHRLEKVQDEILFQKTLDFLVGKANIS